MSPIYRNPGQVFLPISSHPSVRQIHKSSWKLKSCWWSQQGDLDPPSHPSKPPGPQVPQQQFFFLSSGPGDELKECLRGSQECLCLAWQVACLPYAGQDVGVENYFCFLLEMTTVTRASHKSVNCPEGDLPPFKGQ